MEPNAQTCAECNRDLAKQVQSQANEIVRLEERLAAEVAARQVSEDAVKRERETHTKTLEKWQADSNEWRGTVSDIINRCVQRDLWNSEHKALETRLQSVESWHSRAIGAAALFALLLAVAGLVTHYLR